MKLNPVKPRKALNKAWLKTKPNRSQIETFKQNLSQLLEHISETESEEFHKNLVSHFLKNTYYHDRFFINTKEREDLAIYTGKNAGSPVGVIIEAKKPSNKTEMLSVENINTKALHELILYYLRERVSGKNLELKHLVATNIYEWFIFDSTDFEKWFTQNRAFVKQFTDFEEKRLSGTDTGFFYKNIAAPFVEKMEEEITFTYFDLGDIEESLRNQNFENEKKLIPAFKLFSPEHLLKLPFANDSNSLDRGFYNELLHIIGLEETKEGSKKLIGRKAEGKRHPGSFIENAITILNYEDCLSSVKRSDYGTSKDEQLFNVALELSITWINRILFLKLLEGQLVKYHRGDKSFRFLNTERIPDYDALNKLFFQVLAVRENERSDAVKQRFGNIPYLNSSLFEPNDLEHKTIRISNLEDEYTLPVLPATVLTDRTGKKMKGEKNTLHYLFEFLDAYDFASEGSEEIQEENKTIINASVLGLIFEKINGYKDGSFFTPGFITMYMARETMRRAVVEKFNLNFSDSGITGMKNSLNRDFADSKITGIKKEKKFRKYKNIDDVYNAIGTDFTKAEANEIINSLKVCDPAVGSGHFLVSVLNEMIALKSDLKILTDRNGRTLRDYHVEVANDELVITDDEGRLFEYYRGNPEKQRVQEALFHEKQTLIENCLFGVDINPNSVKICRLRLWIELLKNAYYKFCGRDAINRVSATELETLPNIDINIKTGNSLISRYALDSDLKTALKNSRHGVDGYRLAVHTYRNAKNKEQKHEMLRLIETIKNDFETEIAASDKRRIRLNKLKGELFAHSNQQGLFELSATQKKAFNIKTEKLAADIKKLETELEEIASNKIYENAFEWRFEFPEVLNDEGDFNGFDIVIGNPPYIPLEGFDEATKHYFRANYELVERKYETSVLFIILGLKILKYKNILSYIAPVTWQTGENYTNLRKQLFSKWGINKIINLPFDIFADAYVDTAIYFLSNSTIDFYNIYSFDKKEDHNELKSMNFKKISKNLILKPKYKIILNPLVFEIINRIEPDNFVRLGDISISTQGLSPSRFKVIDESNPLYSFPYLKNGNVYNYTLVVEEKYQTSLKNMESLIPFYKKGEKILIRRIVNRQDRLSVGFTDERMVFKKDINPFIIIDKSFLTKYVLAILASKFISYFYVNVSAIALKDDFRQTTLSELREILIPKIGSEKQEKFVNLADKILALKKQNPEADTTELEAEIDRMVYALYGLTEEEVKVVEGT